MKMKSRPTSRPIGGLRRRRLRVPVALFGCLLMSGCSAPAGDGTADTAAFAERVEGAIDAAESGGAGDDQLSILREAQAAGELTFEQAHAATVSTMDCIIEGGGSASYFEDTRTPGLVMPMSMLVAKDDTTLTSLEPLMDASVERESFWVNAVYQLQPSSQASRDAYLEEQAPAIQQCLEDNGYATDPLATPQELAIQAMVVSSETASAVNCYY